MKSPTAGPLGMALVLTLSLTGCGGGGGNGGGSGTSSGGGTATTTAPAPSLSVSAVTPDGLTATLAESAATVSVGGSATYTLTLTNNTTQAISFTPLTGFLPPGSTTRAVGGSLVVNFPTGSVAYPPPNETTTPGGPVEQIATLAPGQSAVGTVVTGNVFSAAGLYSASATFTDQQASATVGPLTVTAQ